MANKDDEPGSRKDREELLKLAEIFQSRMANRQDFEWKIFFGIWGGMIAGGIALLTANDIPPIDPGLSVLMSIMLVLFFVFTVGVIDRLEIGHRNDKEPLFRILMRLCKSHRVKYQPRRQPMRTNCGGFRSEREEAEMVWIGFKFVLTAFSIGFLLIALWSRTGY